MTTRRDTTGTHPQPLAYVVVNPSKPWATDAVRRRAATVLRDAGYADPVWLETTPAEPGGMQAQLAVASGARLVVAAGGDGTVRAVAAGVAHTDVDMAILPLGTANLAARNLGLPVGRLNAALDVAARGTGRRTDLAWVSTEPTVTPVPAPPGGWSRPTRGGEHVCMVVAGVGFDAGLVASTRPELKSRIRWGAYAVAAVANLDSPHMDMVVRVHGTDGGVRIERLRGRTVLVANGGRLPAGITLLREAHMDDGVLDVAVIDTVGGVAGWSSLARQVLPPFAATYSDPGRALGRVTLRRGTEAVVRLAEPALVQVDGELLAPTRGLRARLDAGALLVRRPG